MKKVSLVHRRNQNKLYLLACLLLPFCKGGEKIILPIKSGYMNVNNTLPSQGTTLTIVPVDNYLVRAVENSKITGVFKLDDSYSLLAEGKYRAGYSNLDTVYVEKNMTIRKGQIIGRIRKGYDARLDFNLEKEGKDVTSRIIFTN